MNAQISASDAALEAVRSLNSRVHFVEMESSERFDLSIDIDEYSSHENSSISQYLVGLPDRFPGDDQYPGGGGGWWPPRVIWPPQSGSDDLGLRASPKPWPGGGGGWWPPRAAEMAETSDNDVLRGIFISTESFSDATSGGKIPLVIME
ncbi:MAG: hypothetical protein V2J51_11405 [Erythrobacter sp.]|nr:hypothetical protein [Erythrobacter sp.]